uniref:Uncharacterized protein n=1 Tax=Strongyloides venezuelensis TaxID=75913 RepID=A0A0K0F4G2_STRVS
MNFKFNLSILVVILLTFALNCLAGTGDFRYHADLDLQLRKKRYILDSDKPLVYNLKIRNCDDKISNKQKKVDFKSKDRGEGLHLKSTPSEDDSDLN